MADETLTAIDASFLVAERPGFPLHIGGLAVFEGGRLVDADRRLDIDQIRRLVLGHLDRLPRFRRKVLPAPFGLRLPQWSDAPQFDVRDHVLVAHLDAPGTDDQLFALAAELQQRPIDRSKPLWEMWFIDGLRDGRFGLVYKVHHALVDGVSGAESLAVLLDPDPSAGIKEAAPWTPSPPPPPLQQLVDAATQLMRVPVAAARAATSPRQAADATVSSIEGFAALAQPGRFAPRTSLNASVGDGRVFLPVRQSLVDVKRVGRTFDAKVNDVVLAAVTTGLRSLLAGRGELGSVPYVHALVPVSLRETGNELALGNEVSGVVARLPVQEEDPLERLEALQTEMRSLKAGGDVAQTAGALRTANSFPPIALAALSDLVVHRQPLANLVVTNVPGPQVPLYLLGSRMVEAFPYVPLTRNLSVGVAILSYAGMLNLGITADPASAPDADVLVKGIEHGFAELADLAS